MGTWLLTKRVTRMSYAWRISFGLRAVQVLVDWRMLLNGMGDTNWLMLRMPHLAWKFVIVLLLSPLVWSLITWPMLIPQRFLTEDFALIMFKLLVVLLFHKQSMCTDSSILD